MHALMNHSHAIDLAPALDALSAMNALNASLRAGLSERGMLVDFQALLLAEGVNIDLKRLQLDPGYAQACLGRAFVSPNTALQVYAQRLSTSFLLDS